jgi:hypothetical protein
MWEISKSAQMDHSTVQQLDYSADHHTYSKLLEEHNIDALHSLGIHPIRNQFW